MSYICCFELVALLIYFWLVVVFIATSQHGLRPNSRYNRPSKQRSPWQQQFEEAE